MTTNKSSTNKSSTNKSSTIEPEGVVNLVFAIPVVKINMNREFTKDETDFIQNIPMHKDEKKGMYNYQSKDYYLFENSPNLEDIEIFCENQIERYLQNIEGADTDLAELRITQSWLNKTKPQEYHHLHTHKNSYLSGVFYFKCLPNDGIVFTNRLKGMFDNTEFPLKKPTVWNANGISQNVKEGDLILFPSWIPHSVNRNKTKNKERISLSFNTFPIGEMGNYDSATHLKL